MQWQTRFDRPLIKIKKVGGGTGYFARVLTDQIGSSQVDGVRLRWLEHHSVHDRHVVHTSSVDEELEAASHGNHGEWSIFGAISMAQTNKFSFCEHVNTLIGEQTWGDGYLPAFARAKIVRVAQIAKVLSRILWVVYPEVFLLRMIS